MISCHGLGYNQKKTLTMLASDNVEKPVSFQLFGADIKMMAKAAYLLNEYSPDMVDINMGCPVRKVTKKGAGAALMSTPEIAEKIIREVIKNSSVPVTVKFRKGVNSENINCVEFAKMAEDSGVSGITVHGRTWSQGFTGSADWNAVQIVKNAVSIPVIGNGDVLSYRDGIDKQEKYGCDGIMIGRGALGNPMIFSPDHHSPDLAEILEAALLHLDLMIKYIDVDRLLGVVKNHIGRYFKGIKGSSAIRKNIYSSDSFHELHNYILQLKEHYA